MEFEKNKLSDIYHNLVYDKDFLHCFLEKLPTLKFETLEFISNIEESSKNLILNGYSWDNIKYPLTNFSSVSNVKHEEKNNLELLESRIKNLDSLWKTNPETIYVNSFIEKLIDILKLYTNDYYNYYNILYSIIYPKKKDMVTMEIYNKTIEYLGHPDTWITKLDFIKELSEFTIFNSFLDTRDIILNENCFIVSFDEIDLNQINIITQNNIYRYNIEDYIYRDLDTGITYNIFSDILKLNKNLKFGMIRDF